MIGDAEMGSKAAEQDEWRQRLMGRAPIAALGCDLPYKDSPSRSEPGLHYAGDF
jgi:hypothetical protein